MLAVPDAERSEPYLWRLLIDRMHQRRGVATMAMGLVEAQVAEWGHDSMGTSWVPGRGSPEPFYRARGYEPTGDVDDGEMEARKRW
jgi:GNAT superfamily N-acetyltransferase